MFTVGSDGEVAYVTSLQ